MNRPFYAFGVLMAFLALAMLAIRLSSRPARERPSAGGSGIETPRQQPGVTMFVLVLPDSDREELTVFPEEQVACKAGCGVAAQSPTYEQGSGFNRAAGEVYSDVGQQYVPSEVQLPSQVTGLLSTMIESIEPISLVPDESSALITGYDAVYDRAMSAVAMSDDLARRSIPESVEIDDAEGSDAQDPMFQVFESLSRRETAQTDEESYWIRLTRRRWDYEARAMLAGTVNRLWRELVNARLADDWERAAQQTGLAPSVTVNYQPGPTWAEYEAWIGSKQWTVAGQDTQAGQRVAFWGQPKGELLQIAVAGLNRVAELIHAALARFLDEAAERIAERVDRPTSAGVRN